MKNRQHSESENKTVFKTLLWYLFICEIFLFSLALVIGRGCGYKNTFVAFGCIGVIIGCAVVIFIVISRVIDHFWGE
jgi:Mn2+/Fe2+ NRAMP family transporter